MKKKLKGLEPIIDSNSKILILGSFPRVKSLNQREYYADHRNQFWRIMSDLFNDGNMLKNYQDKKQLLSKNNIAVWDVLKSCYRKGSNDNAITQEQFNNINDLLVKHPNIKVIFFNGRNAERLFKRRFNNLDLSQIYLPSTSGTHSIKYEEKRNEWEKNIKNFCSN